MDHTLDHLRVIGPSRTSGPRFALYPLPVNAFRIFPDFSISTNSCNFWQNGPLVRHGPLLDHFRTTPNSSSQKDQIGTKKGLSDFVTFIDEFRDRKRTGIMSSCESSTNGLPGTPMPWLKMQGLPGPSPQFHFETTNLPFLQDLDLAVHHAPFLTDSVKSHRFVRLR